jgi:hypothetical protein
MYVKGVWMKYSWVCILFLILGCDDDKNTEEGAQVSIFTVNDNDQPFMVNSIDWYQIDAPETLNTLSCEDQEIGCSKWEIDSTITGSIHFKITSFRADIDPYCLEHYSGEKYVELNGSSQDIIIYIYFNGISCE